MTELRLRLFETLPPPGTGGALSISWMQVLPGDRYRAGGQLPQGQPPTLKLIDRRGAHPNVTVATSVDPWVKTQLTSRVERLPAGEYAVEVPSLTGYRAQCSQWRSQSCQAIRVVDRGLTDVFITYEPLAAVKFELVKSDGTVAKAPAVLAEGRRVSHGLF